MRPRGAEWTYLFRIRLERAHQLPHVGRAVVLRLHHACPSERHFAFFDDAALHRVLKLFILFNAHTNVLIHMYVLIYIYIYVHCTVTLVLGNLLLYDWASPLYTISRGL
jgi:hypothetical protein